MAFRYNPVNDSRVLRISMNSFAKFVVNVLDIKYCCFKYACLTANFVVYNTSV